MSDQAAAQAEIRKAEERRCAALSAGKREALEALLLDDFVYVHASARIEDKQAYVASNTAGKFRLVNFERANEVVQVYGDTGIMSGEIKVTREENGASGVKNFRFVGVWIRKGGDWKLAFWQHTPKA